MTKPPKTEWFQAQALQCIGLALSAKDPRIKRLYTLEAQRWLHFPFGPGRVGADRATGTWCQTGFGAPLAPLEQLGAAPSCSAERHPEKRTGEPKARWRGIAQARRQSASAFSESSASEGPHKNADQSRHRVHYEIDPARMPSRHIKLENLNYRAKDHSPNAQNPLASLVGQAKQNADDQERRGVFDIMGRVRGGPEAGGHDGEHYNGRCRCPCRHQTKLPCHRHRLFAAHEARTMPTISTAMAIGLIHSPAAGAPMMNSVIPARVRTSEATARSPRTKSPPQPPPATKSPRETSTSSIRAIDSRHSRAK
jgi:hypothetical protein